MSKARELAELGAVYDSGALSNRNLIINGATQVAQRGTSSTGLGTAEGYFTVDRFKTSVGSTTAGRFTMTQESDGPSALSGIANSIKLACTTADTSIAAGENMRIVYVIEGQDLQRLKKGTSSAESFTISFYVKGNAAATYICEVYDLDNTRHVGKTFNVTTDWNRIELTFPADTTGAITDDATGGIQITFWLHSGTTYTSGTLPATWAAVSNANRAGGLSTSFYDSTSRTFFLSGLQMEVGTEATPFEHRSFGDELLRCQRYYQETSNATNYSMVGDGTCQSSVVSILFDYLCEMRTSPSVSALGTNGSSSWYIQSGSTTISTASAAFNGAWAAGTNSQRAWMDWTGVSGQTASSTAAVYRNNQLTSNKNGCLAFDAEL